MKEFLHLFERDGWFVHATAVHRNICCWLKGYGSVRKAKCQYKHFSPSPSGLFQTWIFQVLNGLHSEKRPSVSFIDVQMNKTSQRRAYFTLSPFLPQHQSEWLCRRKVLWLCQTNWQRLLGLAKSCWPVTGVALHSLYPVGIICVGFSICRRNAIYPADGKNKSMALCDALDVKSKGPLPSHCCW